MATKRHKRRKGMTAPAHPCWRFAIAVCGLEQAGILPNCPRVRRRLQTAGMAPVVGRVCPQRAAETFDRRTGALGQTRPTCARTSISYLPSPASAPA